MKLKYKILLILITLAFVTSLYVGQSYAVWIISDKQTNHNEITSGCFSTNFSEALNNNASSAINLPTAIPTSDSNGLSGQPYTFTISNTCTLSANYSISLNTINTNGIEDNKIKYAIREVTEEKPVAGENLATAEINTETGDLEVDGLKQSYTIETGTLSPSGTSGESKTYELYMWIDNEAGNEVMGETFNAAVRVVSRAAN